MNFERAREIVDAINDRAFYQMGLVESVGSLDGVTLAEMIEAKQVVEARNEAERERLEREHGSATIRVVPDDRLIAAAYALDHYAPNNEAVVLVPTGEWPFNRRALAVVGLEPGDGEDNER